MHDLELQLLEVESTETPKVLPPPYHAPDDVSDSIGPKVSIAILSRSLSDLILTRLDMMANLRDSVDMARRINEDLKDLHGRK